MANNEMFVALKRYGEQYDEANDEMADIFERQANGEHTDLAELFQAMSQRAISDQARRAKVNLETKPIMTALRDVR